MAHVEIISSTVIAFYFLNMQFLIHAASAYLETSLVIYF